MTPLQALLYSVILNKADTLRTVRAGSLKKGRSKLRPHQPWSGAKRLLHIDLIRTDNAAVVVAIVSGVASKPTTVAESEVKVGSARWHVEDLGCAATVIESLQAVSDIEHLVKKRHNR